MPEFYQKKNDAIFMEELFLQLWSITFYDLCYGIAWIIIILLLLWLSGVLIRILFKFWTCKWKGFASKSSRHMATFADRSDQRFVWKDPMFFIKATTLFMDKKWLRSKFWVQKVNLEGMWPHFIHLFTTATAEILSQTVKHWSL